MPAAHRESDPRICGATTIVVGQGTVIVNGKLWAVQNDVNTDGDGQLIPSGSTVIINGRPVIVHAPDSAVPDSLCFIIGGEHCNPMTAGGSGDVFAY